MKIALYFKKHMNNFMITNFRPCFLAIEKVKYFDLFRKRLQLLLVKYGKVITFHKI